VVEFTNLTGVVVFAKVKTALDGARALRVLVRNAAGTKTIGLTLGGEVFETALALLKAGTLAVGAEVRIDGGEVLRSTPQVLKDGTRTTLIEVRYAKRIKSVKPAAPLPPLVRKVTQFA
jgi:hypothetical protein